MIGFNTQHLYVHVPFCAHRCGYCDFVTTSHSPELHERYVRALISEHALRKGDGSPEYSTIYIGGGTPTLLNHESLKWLLERLSGFAADGCEISIECNPETVTPELAAILMDGGVNRVSLGAQSFQTEMLAVLERRATPEIVLQSVETLRAGGINNLSLDVIWGIPGQTESMLRADLAQLIAISPNHISAYELEFKPGTRLTHAWKSVEEAVGDASDEFYEIVIDELASAGYEWYETANFARDGAYSRHNSAYWEQRDYCGMGIGAVGTEAGLRTTNLPNIARYLKAIEADELPPLRTEEISGATRLEERVMLALRLARPLDLTDPEIRAAIDFEAISRLESYGLLEATDTELYLLRKGRLLLNTVLAELLLSYARR